MLVAELGDYSLFGLGQAQPFGVTFKMLDAVGNPVGGQTVVLTDVTAGNTQVMNRTSADNGIIDPIPLTAGHLYTAKALPANPNMPVNPPSVTFVADPTGPAVYNFILGLNQPGVTPPPAGAVTAQGTPYVPPAGDSSLQWLFGLLAVGGAAVGIWWWTTQR
jgi:hypothetical protein